MGIGIVGQTVTGENVRISHPKLRDEIIKCSLVSSALLYAFL